MYIIKRCNKRFNSKVFDTYEAARKYAVRWIRSKTRGRLMHGFKYPALRDYNFSIVKRAA